MAEIFSRAELQRNLRLQLILRFGLSFELFYSVMLAYYRHIGPRVGNDLGFLLGAQSLTFLAFDTPTSLFADRFGYRRCLIIGTTNWALAFGWLAVIRNLTDAIIGNVMQALGIAFCGVANDALARQSIDDYEEATGDKTIKYLAFSSRSMAIFCGAQSAAALIAALLVHQWPNQGPHLAVTIQCVLAAALIPIAWSVKEARRVRVPIPAREVRRLTRRQKPGLWPLICYAAVLHSATSTTVALMQPHLLGHLHGSPSTVSVTLAIGFLVAGGASLFIGKYDEYLGEQWVILSLLGWIALGFGLLWLAPGWWSLSGIAVMYVTMALHYVLLGKYLLDRAKKWKAGVLSAKLGLSLSLTTVLNPLLGWTAHHYGMALVWNLDLVIHVPLAGLCLIFLFRRPR